MKPITFKEKTVVFAEDQPQYEPLPAYLSRAPEGEVICCWGLAFWERLYILFTGRLWLRTLTFHQPLQPLQPLLPQVKSPFVRVVDGKEQS